MSTTSENRDLAWIENITRPRLDYWAAKHLITHVLSLIPDSEFEHFDFERKENLDGTVELQSYDEGLRFMIGMTDPLDGRPDLPHRKDGVERVLQREALHRLDQKHWAERLAGDKNVRHEAALALVKGRAADMYAEDVIAGRVIHNVETGLLVMADVATDEERAEAVAAYKRMLAAKDTLGDSQ